MSRRASQSDVSRRPSVGRSITTIFLRELREEFEACPNAALVACLDEIHRDDWAARDPLTVSEWPAWEGHSKNDVGPRVSRWRSERKPSNESLNVLARHVALDLVERDEAETIVGRRRDTAEDDIRIVLEVVSKTSVHHKSMNQGSPGQVAKRPASDCAAAFPRASQF
jgi:hypothetical protein